MASSSSSSPNTPTTTNPTNFFSLHLITLVITLLSIFLPIILTSILFLNSSSLFPNPISIASQCTILSTSVDIRSSKVCELGFLNYKAKNVFYPSQNTNFRCRYDYYWASIFKVEYKEYSSGHTRRAYAEAPKEALPIDCRPTFTVAWSTKEMFEVNGTYNCRYTPGIPQVDLNSDGFFNCHANDPSFTEMTKRYIILSARMISSFLYHEMGSKLFTRHLFAGILVGIFTGLITVTLITIFLTPRYKVSKTMDATRPHAAVNPKNHALRICFRFCFLVAHLSLVGWLTLQYGNMIGLTKIFTDWLSSSL